MQSKNNLSKESLELFAIISAENKTDTRIYGTIYQSHEIENIEQVSEGTIQPYDGVRKRDDKNPDS